MSSVSVAMVAAPVADAPRIARALVEEGIVACVNLVPQVRSIYRWKGKVEDEAETLLVLKFASADVERVKARVVALHSYEVPEFIRFEVVDGHAPYLDWVLSRS